MRTKKRIIIIIINNTITIYFQTSTKFENLRIFNAIKIRYIFKLLTNNRMSSDLLMFYECHVTFWCCHVTKQEVLDIFEIKSWNSVFRLKMAWVIDIFMFYECHVTFWCCHVTKREVPDIFAVERWNSVFSLIIAWEIHFFMFYECQVTFWCCIVFLYSCI